MKCEIIKNRENPSLFVCTIYLFVTVFICIKLRASPHNISAGFVIIVLVNFTEKNILKVFQYDDNLFCKYYPKVLLLCMKHTIDYR